MRAPASLFVNPVLTTCFVATDRDRAEGGERFRVVVTSPTRRWESLRIERRDDAEAAARVIADFVGADCRE